MPTVHLWYAVPVAAGGLAHLLDDTERTRLGRLRQAADRDAFATGRVLARRLGAELTGASVADVAIDSTCPRCGKAHGKARYAATGSPGLSVTHAPGLVAVAASEPGTEVGVDLEPLIGSTDLMATAATFLSPSELDAHRLRPAAERPLALLRTWVRKEAALKATGDGLLLDPALLVLGSPDTPAELLAWGATDPAPDVRLADVAVDPAYLACVAVVGDQPVTVTVTRHEVAP